MMINLFIYQALGHLYVLFHHKKERIGISDSGFLCNVCETITLEERLIVQILLEKIIHNVCR